MEKSLEMQLKIANNELKRLKRNAKDIMQIATYNSEKLEPYKIKAEAWDAFFKCNPQAIYDFINNAKGDDEKYAFIVNCAVPNIIDSPKEEISKIVENQALNEQIEEKRVIDYSKYEKKTKVDILTMISEQGIIKINNGLFAKTKKELIDLYEENEK